MNIATTSESHPLNSSWPWRAAGSAEGGRLDGVDILRGLAILFVLMNHVNIRLLGARIPYTHGLPEQLVSSLVWNGQRGVQMFFAISGFLITSTTLRRWPSLSNIRVRDFYWLRFARIAPLLILLLAVLLSLHFAHVRNFVVSPKTGGPWRALFAALTLHVNVLEAQRGYLPANWDILWSLSVEEVFYFFFPLVCWLAGRRKVFVGILLLLVALGPFSRAVLTQGNAIWHEYSYLGGMDAIALGCLTALLVSNRKLPRRFLRIFASAGIAVVVLSLCFSLLIDSWGFERNGLNMTILAIGTCMLIAPAAQTRWSSPRLAAPLLTLGHHSYEIYLTHMFVVFALFNTFLGIGKPLSAVPALFVGVILLSGALGLFVARLYSDPINRLIRSFLRIGRASRTAS